MQTFIEWDQILLIKYVETNEFASLWNENCVVDNIKRCEIYEANAIGAPAQFH